MEAIIPNAEAWKNIDMLQQLSNFNGMISTLLKFNVNFTKEEKFVLLIAILFSSYDHLIATLIYKKATIEFKIVYVALISFEK